MMTRPADSRTRASLLFRLRQNANDPGSWKEFVERYGPKIYRWCKAWNLQDADADDVSQEVLLRLTKALGEFNYDFSRSFRAWLNTITRHALCDFQANMKRVDRVAADSAFLARLETVEAREDLERRLAEEFDLEVKEEALARVQLRVEPHTWEAFRLQDCEGVSAEEVARRQNMKVAMVHVARCRVIKMIREEVRKLLGGEENA